MIRIKLGIIIFLLIFITFKTYSTENVFVAYKVNDQIITNIDIKNESKYLMALNNQLRNLTDKKILEIAKESIIKEKIKEIELLKYFTLDQSNSLLDKVIKDFYLKLKLNNENEFARYLAEYNLTIDDVKKKVVIETTWNKLIYERYKNQIDIDKDALQKRLINKNKSNTKKIYLLSEIVFEKNKEQPLNKIIEKIYESIEEIGFKNTANIYSISDSAKFGGSIGWIEEENISKKIIKITQNLKVNTYTKPIKLGNGFIIIKLDNVKIEKIKINKKEELDKMIVFESNRQLNQFSKIYFNKIKINTNISEL